MKFRYTLEVLTLVAILGFCAAFFYTSMFTPDADFIGSDIAGSGLIAELSGKPLTAFQPLIPQWEPPSSEVEACLFALQAAVGGILVGGVFGYWIGLKSKA